MKHLFCALLLLFTALLCLAVLSTRTVCPHCGGPIYLYLIKFCPCK